MKTSQCNIIRPYHKTSCLVPQTQIHLPPLCAPRHPLLHHVQPSKVLRADDGLPGGPEHRHRDLNDELLLAPPPWLGRMPPRRTNTGGKQYQGQLLVSQYLHVVDQHHLQHRPADHLTDRAQRSRDS